MNFNPNYSKSEKQADYDVVAIGGGFSGLYMIQRAREAGFSVKTFEAGGDVGGVWYWHTYPGLRCDVESLAYCYLFSEDLYKEWAWSSRYPSQPEILRYINYVADKFDLRRDIQFNTRIKAAHFDEANGYWEIFLDDNTSVTATYFVPTVGGLTSAPNVPDFEGLNSFEGDWYHTGNWPEEQVDFKGKRVGVIGTGSSGMQVIPEIAKEAAHLTVFQRTPQYTIPAGNHSLDPEYTKQIQQNYKEIKRQIRNSRTGDFKKAIDKSALEVPEEERLQAFESGWKKGGGLPRYNDLFIDEKANETYGEFVRSKIAAIVEDPEKAQKLMPYYHFGTKRIPLSTNYYETYNKRNVELADVKSAPIQRITPEGLLTSEKEYKLDTLVFATGYDAITGPLFKIEIRGRNGVSLKEKWKNGAEINTYLGLAMAGFPNMFMVAGPESPGAVVNNLVVIESNVEWIVNCFDYLRKNGIHTIEANRKAEVDWSNSLREMADSTLFIKTESWWTGANIANKPRSFPIYLGGFAAYHQICEEVAAEEFKGFSLSGKSEKVRS